MSISGELVRRCRFRGVVLSGLVLFATVVVVGYLTPGYSQLTETVSRLASPGQPYAFVARAGFVLYGVLVIASARPLGDLVPGKERLLGGLIGLFGAAAVTAGIAPKDAPLAAHTTASRIHVGATLVGGTAIIMAMALVAARAPRDTDRHTAAVAAILTGVTVIVFKLSWGSRIYGLAERVLLASPTLWFVALAVQPASIDHESRAERQPVPTTELEEYVHPSTARPEPRPPERLSLWPHVVWATFVIGVVAVILLAAGQTRMPEGGCSGLGFGCSLYGADAAGFLAFFIVPPAIGILAVGHALIAAARRISRRYHTRG